MPKKQNDQVKVVFPFEEGAETMWADPLPNGHYRLDNIPMFIDGLSLGDVFQAKPVEGDDRPYFDKVVQRSNNWTYRVYLLENRPPGASSEIEQSLEHVRQYAEGWTRYGDEYFIYNIPNAADRLQLERILDDGEEKQYWEYEIGSSPDDPL